MHPTMEMGGIYLHQPGDRRQSTAQLIGDFLPEVGVGLMIGEAGIGKTFCSIAMASALATGRALFDKWAIAERGGSTRFDRQECGATLFVLSEGHEFFSNRLDAAYFSLDATDRDQLLNNGFSSLPAYMLHADNWQDDETFDQCERQIRQLVQELSGMETAPTLDLIVLDTISGVFSPRDENNASETQRIMSKMCRLSQRARAFVLGIHHPAKHASAREGRGSNVFGGVADLTISISKSGKRTARKRFMPNKVRDAESNSSSVEFELISVSLSNGESSVVARRSENVGSDRVEQPKESSFSEYETALFEAIEIAAFTTDVTHSIVDGVGLIEVARDKVQAIARDALKGTGRTDDTIRRSLNRTIQTMVTSGVIKSVEGAGRDARLVLQRNQLIDGQQF